MSSVMSSKSTATSAADFSGFLQNLAGPIDEYDPDYAKIMENRYNRQLKHGLSEMTIEVGGKSDISIGTIIRPVPRDDTEKLCVWIDFPKPTVDNIMKMKTFTELKDYLHDIFQLNSYKDTLKEHVITDLYAYAVQFGHENKFNLQQMSTFLGIIKRVHDMTLETPFDNQRLCFEYFKDLLLSHSMNMLPIAADIFTLDIADMIMKYMMNTYFKHYRLYKSVFTPKVTMNLSIKYPQDQDDEDLCLASTIASAEVNGEENEWSFPTSKSNATIGTDSK